MRPMRPPTEREMELRAIELERPGFWSHDPEAMNPAYPTFAELNDYMHRHGIPVDRAGVAYGHCGSHMLVLEWGDYDRRVHSRHLDTEETA